MMRPAYEPAILGTLCTVLLLAPGCGILDGDAPPPANAIASNPPAPRSDLISSSPRVAGPSLEIDLSHPAYWAFLFVLQEASGELEEVRRAFEDGDVERAQNLVDEYVASHPDDPEGLDLRVRLLEARWRFVEAREVYGQWLERTGVPNPERALRTRCDEWAGQLLRLAASKYAPGLELLTQGVQLNPSGHLLAQLHGAYEQRVGWELVEELTAGGALSRNQLIAIFDLVTEAGEASPRGEAIARAVREELTRREYMVLGGEETAQALRAAILSEGRNTSNHRRAAQQANTGYYVHGTIGTEASLQVRQTGARTLAASAKRAYPFSGVLNRELRVTMTVAYERRERDTQGAWTRVIDKGTLSPGRTLRDHDSFQLTLRIDHEAYVYVLYLGSSMEIERLFPEPTFELKHGPQFSNPLSPDRPYVLPQPGHVYLLDDVPGVETIYVFASFQPMPDLARLVDRMRAAVAGGHREEAAAARDEIEQLVRTRGLAGVAEGNVDGVMLSGELMAEVVSQVFSGFDIAVRRFTFKHVQRR